jgi:hypothetical protein
MNKTAQLIGYWHEGGPSSWVHPFYLVDPTWDPQERNAVISYLRSGKMHAQYMGYSSCRFICGNDRMGTQEFTDGTFFWPEGLPHYLETHDVRLPMEFVDHAIGRKKFDKSLHAGHDDYWKSVCAKYPHDQPIQPDIREENGKIVVRPRPPIIRLPGKKIGRAE